MIRKLFKQLSGSRIKQPNERDLIRMESVIGGRLFGPVPKGHNRQFFCLDERTWIWYESWTDQAGNPHSMTTRYEVRPDGIIKAQDGKIYAYVGQEEAQNLVEAARLYSQEVSKQIYHKQAYSL